MADVAPHTPGDYSTSNNGTGGVPPNDLMTDSQHEFSSAELLSVADTASNISPLSTSGCGEELLGVDATTVQPPSPSPSADDGVIVNLPVDETSQDAPLLNEDTALAEPATSEIENESESHDDGKAPPPADCDVKPPQTNYHHHQGVKRSTSAMAGGSCKSGAGKSAPGVAAERAGGYMTSCGLLTTSSGASVGPGGAVSPTDGGSTPSTAPTTPTASSAAAAAAMRAGAVRTASGTANHQGMSTSFGLGGSARGLAGLGTTGSSDDDYSPNHVVYRKVS